MQFGFKKNLISFTVLGLAIAAHPSFAMQSNRSLWTTHFSGAFIGVEGLNLRPMNDDLDYVTIFPVNYPASSNRAFYNNAVSTVHAIERPDEGFINKEINTPRLSQPPVSANYATTKTSNFSDQGSFIGISLGTDWV